MLFASLSPFRKSVWLSLRTYHHILFALCLHDIKSRFFGNGLGQITMLLWPFVHILVLLALYSFTGRVTPYGSSLLLYASTGVLPFMIFSYSSRWIMYSVVQNKSCLSYPVVTVLDLMAARALLETLSNYVLTVMLILFLVLLNVNASPADYSDAIAAWAASIFLSIGLGVLNGTIATMIPMWTIVYVLIIIMMYVSSGILFVPSTMPTAFRDALAWNPVLQTVEWMRTAFYSDYSSLVLNRAYVLRFSLICLTLGLLLECFTRRLRSV